MLVSFYEQNKNKITAEMRVGKRFLPVLAGFGPRVKWFACQYAVRYRHSMGNPHQNVAVRRATFQRATGEDQGGLSQILPAVLMFYAFLLPPEVRIQLLDQMLNLPRLVGLAFIPLILMRFTRGNARLVIWDGIFVFGVAWTVVALMQIIGAVDGLLRGTGAALDIILPYLVARVSIRNADDLRRFLVFAAPGVLIVASAMFIEVLASKHLVRPFFISIFGPAASVGADGQPLSRELFTEYRRGILRTMGPFSHPIHAGVFLASTLSLYLLSGLRGWPKVGGVLAAAGTILSVSSAAILVLLGGAALVVVDRIQRVSTFLSWKLILIVMAVGTIALHLISENGVVNFFTRFTLSPGTARFRVLIWEYGSQSVWNNPWFGIGFNSYERPDWMNTGSVDAHWLAIAMKSGVIPAFAMLAVPIAGATILGLAARNLKEVDRDLYIGVAISVSLIVLIGFTVAFFGNVQIWFYMLFAFAISLGQVAQSRPVPQFHGLKGNPRPSAGPIVRRVQR